MKLKNLLDVISDYENIIISTNDTRNIYLKKVYVVKLLLEYKETKKYLARKVCSLRNSNIYDCCVIEIEGEENLLCEFNETYNKYISKSQK